MAMKGKRRRFVLGSAPCCGISENGSICDKAVCSNHVRSCPENDRIADTPQNSKHRLTASRGGLGWMSQSDARLPHAHDLRCAQT
jgi:hypothetical protein